MARFYLGLIVVLGLMGSLLGRMNSVSPSSGRSSAENPYFDAVKSRETSLAGGGESRGITTSSDGAVELERSHDGHFYADVQINGASVRALVDTGASGIALSREDARTAGLATSIGMPDVVGRGADGDVHGEIVTLDSVTLGHKTAEDMQAVVLNSGEMTLLGQNFLSKFDSVEIRGDTMVLR